MRSIALVVGLAVLTASCSGGGGGGGGGACEDWESDDADHAASFLGTGVAGGGTTAVSGSTLTISFDGTLAAGEMAAIYSKGTLAGNYGAFARLESVASTTTSMGAFFALQDGYHGLAWSVADRPDTSYDLMKSDGHDQGHWDVNRLTTSIPMFVSVERDGFDTVYEYGSGNGNYAGITGPLVVGFGIQNISDPPTELTGQVTAVWTAFAVVDSADNCFVSGLE